MFWGGWGSHIVVHSGAGQTTAAATVDHTSQYRFIFTTATNSWMSDWSYFEDNFTASTSSSHLCMKITVSCHLLLHDVKCSWMQCNTKLTPNTRQLAEVLLNQWIGIFMSWESDQNYSLKQKINSGHSGFSSWQSMETS